MQATFAVQVRRVRQFWRGKCPKVSALAVAIDVCAPSRAMTAYPKQTGRLVVPSCLCHILHVKAVSYIAQVFNTIVCCVPVYVVNVIDGPRSVYVKPRKSVRPIKPAANSYNDVALSVHAPSLIAEFDAATQVCFPLENASVGVVVKNLAQTRGGKIGSSHEAVLSLIGQRLTSVDALGGLRYFTPRVAL